MTTAIVHDVRVIGIDDGSVRQAHALFQETLGIANVEDIESFRATTSPGTVDAVVPKLVGTCEDDELVGAMLGLYLGKLDAGMILYAGVREDFRGQGMYSKMRSALLSELRTCSSSNLEFVLSEIEVGDWLLQKYLNEWNGFVAPCDYVQPAVQGLPRRRLNLVVVPMVSTRNEITESLGSIIREVYRGVYRMAEPEGHPDFVHTVESFRP